MVDYWRALGWPDHCRPTGEQLLVEKAAVIADMILRLFLTPVTELLHCNIDDRFLGLSRHRIPADGIFYHVSAAHNPGGSHWSGLARGAPNTWYGHHRLSHQNTALPTTIGK